MATEICSKSKKTAQNQKAKHRRKITTFSLVFTGPYVRFLVSVLADCNQKSMKEIKLKPGENKRPGVQFEDKKQNQPLKLCAQLCF